MTRTFTPIQCMDCGETCERSGARQRRCVECHAEKERERKRAYYQANREKALEYHRAYREANREEKREYNRAYYEANQEKMREYNRAYSKANREGKREYLRAYREANPVATATRDRARRAARPKGDPALKGQRWSPGEDALAMNPDLPIAAVCELTGRSFEAVMQRRHRLRKKLQMTPTERAVEAR